MGAGRQVWFVAQTQAVVLQVAVVVRISGKVEMNSMTECSLPVAAVARVIPTPAGMAVVKTAKMGLITTPNLRRVEPKIPVVQPAAITPNTHAHQVRMVRLVRAVSEMGMTAAAAAVDTMAAVVDRIMGRAPEDHLGGI